MARRFSRRRWLVGAAVLAVVTAGCGGSDAGDGGDGGGAGGGGAAPAGPVKVGAVLGISGRFAFVGAPQQQALELARDQINASGGISGRQVELVVYDDEVDETKTVPLVNRLINEDQVVAVIGPSITVPALAMTPVVERAKIPNITLTSKAIWADGKSRYVFQTTPREEIEVQSVLAFIRSDLRTSKVGVIYDRQPYGTGNLAFLKQFAPQFGLSIVAEESIENGDTAATAQVQRLRSAGAEVVITWVGDPAASSIAKAIQQVGWTVPMIGSSAIAGPRFPQLGGPAAEGVYSNGTLNYASPPASQVAFLTDFRAKYGSAPTQFAAFAYDGLYALKGAIEHAGGKTGGDAIRQGLLDMRPYDGISGRYDFTEDNRNGLELAPQFLIVQVKGGAFTVVKDTRGS